MNNIKIWQWHFGANKTVGRFDAGEMTAREKFTYFALAMVFGALAMFVTAWSIDNFEISFTKMDILDEYLYIITTAVGLGYLYKQHTEQTSFIEKFFVVLIATIPVVLVLSCIVAVSFYTLLSLAIGEIGEQTMWYDVVFNVVLSVGTFWKMGSYFR
jgi:hypothetical protein